MGRLVDSLNDNGWTQGQQIRDHDETYEPGIGVRTKGYCLLGHFCNVYLGSPYSNFNLLPYKLIKAAFEEIEWEVWSILRQPSNPLGAIISWNDTPGRTEAEVRDLFKLVEEKLDGENGR